MAELISELLNSQQSIPALLGCICVMLTFHFLVRVGEIAAKTFRNNTELTEKSINALTTEIRKNTSAMEKLERRIVDTEKTLSKLPVLELKLGRLFTAVKMLAGDDWTKIRREILSDDISS